MQPYIHRLGSASCAVCKCHQGCQNLGGANSAKSKKKDKGMQVSALRWLKRCDSKTVTLQAGLRVIGKEFGNVHILRLPRLTKKIDKASGKAASLHRKSSLVHLKACCTLLCTPSKSISGDLLWNECLMLQPPKR